MMYYHELHSMYYHQKLITMIYCHQMLIIMAKIQENHQQLQRRPEQLDLERPVRENIISEYLQNNYLQHCLCNDHMYDCIIANFACKFPPTNNLLVIYEGDEQAGPFVLSRRLAASVQVSPKNFNFYDCRSKQSLLFNHFHFFHISLRSSEP